MGRKAAERQSTFECVRRVGKSPILLRPPLMTTSSEYVNICPSPCELDEDRLAPQRRFPPERSFPAFAVLARFRSTLTGEDGADFQNAADLSPKMYVNVSPIPNMLGPRRSLGSRASADIMDSAGSRCASPRSPLPASSMPDRVDPRLGRGSYGPVRHARRALRSRLETK